MSNMLLAQRPSSKEFEAAKAMDAQHGGTDARVWDRANTMQERRQEQVRVGVPTQVVLKEGDFLI